ncbi:actin cortical patch SUR7/pH-response regulator pali [Corynascus similis CBS 632.67]
MAFKVALIFFAFLSMLFMAIALSSGSGPGHLESVSIIHFDTSKLGQKLVDEAANKAKDACNKVEDTVKDVAEEAKDGAKKVLDNLPFARRDSVLENRGACDEVVEFGKEAANKGIKAITDVLGIREYYSVHIGALCEGDFKSSDDSNRDPEVDDCTPKFDAEETDLSKLLNSELKDGLKLSDLGIVGEIQDKINMIPEVLAKMAYPFLIIVLLLAAGFLFAVAVLVFEYVLTSIQVIALYGGLGCLGLGSFCSLIAAMAATITAEKIKNKVNEKGEAIGLSSNTSPAFYFLLWGSLICSCIALGLLICLWIVERKVKRAAQEKNGSDSSMSGTDNHGYVDMQTHGGRGE